MVGLIDIEQESTIIPKVIMGELLIGFAVLSFLSYQAVAQELDANAVQYSVFEEEPAGMFVGNILRSANIQDNLSSFREIKVSFLGSSSYEHLFSIDGRLGVITTADVIDRETVCMFSEDCILSMEVTIYVRHNDNSNSLQLHTVVPVHININDKNDNDPTFFNNEINVTVSESVGVGHSITIRGATDLDVGENVVKQYTLDTETFGLQVIKNAGGSADLAIIINEELDREKVDIYTLVISAIDGGTPSRTGSVLVNMRVSDVNDNRPVFTNTSLHIAIEESIYVGAAILQISATDADEGKNSRVAYSFDSRTPQSVRGVLALDVTSGVISIKNEIDYETMQQYKFLVEAADNGDQPQITRALVTIDIVDVNDNPPVISVNLLPGGVRLTESAPSGTYVADMTVKDNDSGMNGDVTCSIINNKFNLVEYYTNLYKITLETSLDFEKSTIENVSIKCVDAGDPQLETVTSFFVYVGDVNDHSPVFLEKSYTKNMQENNEIGEVVIVVSAVDYDGSPNNRILYSIEDKWKSTFSIHPTTGVVMAAVSLDREQTPSIIFTVAATDSASNPRATNCNVTLYLSDVNDVVPSFTKRTYRIHVPEDKYAGEIIGKVAAVDADLGDNGLITMSVIETSPQFDRFIRFNVNSGTISTIRSLDREQTETIRARIHVSDRGNPPMTSTAEILIVIEDVNDNSPIILFPNDKNSTQTLAHNSFQGEFVTRVLALDKDIGQNSNLVYNIESVDPTVSMFYIETDTGVIRLSREMDMSEIARYTIHVSVMDGGEPALMTRCRLDIDVFYSNESRALATIKKNENRENMIIIVIIVGITIIISAMIVGLICILRRLDNIIFCSRKKPSLSKPCSFESIYDEKLPPNTNASFTDRASMQLDDSICLGQCPGNLGHSPATAHEKCSLFVSVCSQSVVDEVSNMDRSLCQRQLNRPQNLDSSLCERKSHISDNSDSGRGLSEGENDEQTPKKDRELSPKKPNQKYFERYKPFGNASLNDSGVYSPRNKGCVTNSTHRKGKQPPRSPHPNKTLYNRRKQNSPRSEGQSPANKTPHANVVTPKNVSFSQVHPVSYNYGRDLIKFKYDGSTNISTDVVV